MDTKKFIFVYLLWMLLDYVCSSCDLKIAVKSGQEFELTSPNYPSNFSQNLHCFYDLTTQFSSGDILHVFVLDVSLSCDDNANTLEVFDAFNTSPRYLGKVCAGGVTKFVSPKERLYLVFRSGSRRDNEVSRRGFRLNVMSVPEYSNCYSQQAKVMPALPETQHILSPYYPFEVAPNVHCRWLLKAQEGYRVHLEVLHADMKGSNDCSNFGLYIFDGKTTYDDEKLGSVCSNNIQSFYSASNYLMVTFISGAHVLHSGGGIKLGYYSSPADSNGAVTDSKLLFILVGVLVAIASFTIIMIILRVFIIPARRQSLARRYTPSHRNSNMSSSSLATISIPNEPPPPYQTNDQSHHKQKGNCLWTSACGCCLRNAKAHGQRNSQSTVRHFTNDFAYFSGEGEFGSCQMTPQILSALTGDSLTAVLNHLRSNTDVTGELYSGEITFNRSSMSPQLNEYHELPVSTNVGIVEDRDEDTDVVNRYSSGQTTRYYSIDSGYQEIAVDGDSTCGDNLSSREDTVQVILRDVDNAAEAVSVSNVKSLRGGREGSNSLNASMVVSDRNTTSREVNAHDRSTTSREVHVNDRSTTSREVHVNDRSTTSREVDDNGYEIPISSHLYDRVRDSILEDEEEEEGVYHNLEFHTDES